MTTPTELAVPSGGTSLHVEIDEAEGQVPTFLFVNGLNLTIHHWRSQRAGLASAGRLVFYDHRGHGRSGKTSWRRATIRQTALDLKAVIDAVTTGGPLVLVGHSMGGTVIAALAAEHPELFGRTVTGVALVESLPGRWGDVSYGLGMKVSRPLVVLSRLLGPVRLLSAACFWAVNSVAVRIRPRWAPTSPRVRAADRARGRTTLWGVIMSASTLAFTALSTDAMVCDHSRALPVIGRAATLVVAGTGDPYIPDETKTRLAELIPGAKLLVVADGGHSSHRRRADLVNAELIGLAARAVPRAGTEQAPA